jgi:curved DNA-binding protein CbpA
MAADEQIEGVGSLEALVRRAPNVDITKAQLSLEEGFVFSRIDGAVTVAQLCETSGLGKDATLSAIRRLSICNLVVVQEKSRAAKTNPKRASLSPGMLETLAEVEADPDDIDLHIETRLRIRSAYKMLDSLSHFGLLQVDQHADEKEIRRAYFARSKEFHPDRFYSKSLGDYAGMLDEIFKKVRASFKFLGDEERRLEYRQNVAGKMRKEAGLRELEQRTIKIIREERESQTALDGMSPGGVGKPAEGEKAPQHPSRRSGSQLLADLTNRRIRQTLNVAKARQSTSEMESVADSSPDLADDAPIVTPEEIQEREQRRDDDKRRRRKSMAHGTPSVARRKRALEFYKQGMHQLEAGKFLAAAASLKLALSYDPHDDRFQRCYDQAVEQSREVTAEGFFKRAIFEESVGRHESAGLNFVKAADLFPKQAYLEKAAEACLWSDDLMKAKDYGTKAVQKEPNSADARLLLAEAYYRAGMAKNALREAELANKIRPGNSDIKDLLKKIRRS